MELYSRSKSENLKLFFNYSLVNYMATKNHYALKKFSTLLFYIRKSFIVVVIQINA